MKIPLLPDLDLARIAPLQSDRKRFELRQMKRGFPPYSYGPMRRFMLDILNIEAGPLGIVPRTPWSEVAAGLQRLARSEVELEANLAVSSSLYDFSEQNKVRGTRHDFFPLSVGISGRVVYWLSSVIVLDGQMLVPFIDPRRTKKLTAESRRFVFSMMHERIRAADPDYEAVGLGIIQFDSDGKFRVPKLFTAENIELLDFEVLNEMVQETYRIWAEVLDERKAETRRRGAGGSGPLV